MLNNTTDSEAAQKRDTILPVDAFTVAWTDGEGERHWAVFCADGPGELCERLSEILPDRDGPIGFASARVMVLPGVRAVDDA